jgi:fructose-1,6-bisphosphatase/inositol monophosphatase family enzyme
MIRYEELSRMIRKCGDYAADKQSGICRNFKNDGSVLTETDLYIDRFLVREISRLFPEAAVLSEESGLRMPERNSAAAPELYFILDPVDGTDVYSQGMPAWCVALGILDNTGNPVGAMVYAPRWGPDVRTGLFVRLDPEHPQIMTINGVQFEPRKEFSKAPLRQIVISSKIHKTLDLRRFNGKCRNFGSSILHLLSPVIHEDIDASISAGGFIWDIAAAHSVLSFAGMELSNLEGVPFSCSTALLNGTETGDILIAGSSANCKAVRETFSPVKVPATEQSPYPSSV